MRAFTEYCVEKSIRDWEDTNNPEVRNRYAALEGWASIVVNLVLAVLKGFFGVISGSVALIADAFHTLSDRFAEALHRPGVGDEVSDRREAVDCQKKAERMEENASLHVRLEAIFSGLHVIQSSFIQWRLARGNSSRQARAA